MTFDTNYCFQVHMLYDDTYQVKLLVWEIKQQNMKNKNKYLNSGTYILT